MAQKNVTRTTRSDRRSRLRQAAATIRALKAESGDTAMFSRQEEEVDEFSGLYAEHHLIEPPYSFASMYRIYGESDVLQECVDAYVQNIDGFGYIPVFLGDDLTEKDSPESQQELARMMNFFDLANPDQSWRTLRKLVREDVEVMGNGGIELVRSNNGKLQLAYYAPFRNVRLSRMDPTPVTINAKIVRDGEEISVPVRKHFRKFCMISQTGAQSTRWFKEFGDPRLMNAANGEFEANPKMPASEILHIKIPSGGRPYGVPRWISAILDVIGRRSAQYINYDLFDSQGIPPMAVVVSGGVLTDESYEELEILLRGMRGVERWNKIVVLESTVEGTGLDEKGSAKIELKNLSEYRKEDQMFERYIAGAETSIRQRYRLPPLYVGGTDTFTHATADAAEKVVEEQVFIPEREGFDEEINRKIVVSELGIRMWAYKTKGPRALSSEDITKGVRAFQIAGALTVNHAVALANQAFGLEMSQYEQTWADYPINIVMELIKEGRLLGLDEIDSGPAPQAPPPPMGGMKSDVRIPAKVLKSDMFSKEEKSLYKRLLTIQSMVSQGFSDEDLARIEAEQEL